MVKTKMQVHAQRGVQQFAARGQLAQGPKLLPQQPVIQVRKPPVIADARRRLHALAQVSNASRRRLRPWTLAGESERGLEDAPSPAQIPQSTAKPRCHSVIKRATSAAQA